ncbi:MAG: glycosyltransferase family 2 protein, partial [Myxococcota bacterium]
MLRKLSSLSIVLPCHNEAESVARVVADAFLHGSEYASALEVVVVDDGSTDGTCAQVGSLQQVYRSLRLMRHSRQRGYGAALQTGFRACNHDYVFYT